MKKIVLSLLVLATILVSIPQLFATGSGKGNLVVHFKKWDSVYTDLGSHGWGADNFAGKVEYDGTDDFGVYFEFNDLAVVAATDTSSYGFIAVNRPNKGEPDWNSKFTGDINIAKTVVKEDKTVHVYVFQGNAASTATDPRYFVADPEKYNALITYFDPSGVYEDNLGVHNWNWTNNAAEWNQPLKVFTTGGNTAGGVPVKVAMLHANPSTDPATLGKAPDAGLLIYFGDGDNSKKSGNITLAETLGYEATTPNVLGATGFSYVYNMGNGVTNNENVFNTNADYETYAEEAFSFKLQPYSVNATTGAASGTYAVKDDQIIVKTSTQVSNPYAAATTDAEKAAALATMTGWFKVVVKGTTTSLSILRVDFAQRNATVSDFVVVLQPTSRLDISKQYVIQFNDGTNQAELDLNIDNEAPVITLDGDNVIEVAWGKPFNLADFPLYAATDNRDGDITAKVFVPAGEKSTLNTAVEGEYEIMLQVEDNWGNVTQLTFTFKVVKA